MLILINRLYYHCKSGVLFLFCIILLLTGADNLYAQMSGSYLVKSDGTGDFITIQDAANALVQQGVTGSVIINLATGTYEERVIIDSIPGTSPVNTVTFRSQTGDASAVTVFTKAVTAQDTNFVMFFRNVRHIQIKHLTLHNQSPDFRQVLTLAGSCEDIEVANNIILGGPQPSGNQDYAINVGSLIGATIHNPQGKFSFNNNHIETQYGGIKMGALVPDSMTQFKVSGNRINAWNGVYISGLDSIEVTGNVLDGQNYGGIGIRLAQVNGALVHSNRAFRHDGALHLNMCARYLPVYIYNNIFSSRGEAAMTFSWSDEVYVYFNSVLNQNTSNGYAYTGGFLITDSSVVLENNIFCNYGKGGVVLGAISLLDVSDYNAYYTRDDTFHYDFAQVASATLADWQVNTGFDANSIATDPFFDTDSTLVPIAGVLKGSARFIPWITTDINGTPRDPAAVTIGAVEITSHPNLEPQAIQVQPDTVFTGNGIQVSYEGVNTGSATVNGSWRDGIYLCSSPALADSVVRLAQPAVSRFLPPGASYYRQLTLGVPDTLTGGTYYLWVVVNENAGVFEDLNDNAGASGAIQILPKDRPNLQVVSVSVPAAIQSAQIVKITWTVENTGTVPTASSWYDYIYWHNDSAYFINPATFKPDSMLLFAIEAPSGLLPGEQYTQSKDYRLPLQMSGVYYATVFADGGGQILEEIEGTPDNIGLAPVNVSQLPLADLEVVEVNIPATVFSGDQLQFSYKIRNAGSAKTGIDERIDRVILSRDSVPDDETLDHYVRRKTLRHDHPLDPLDEHIVQDSIAMPSCKAGKFYLYVITNWYHDMPEITRINNLNNDGPVEVVLLPNPDLIVTQVDVITPNPETESAMIIEFTIKNDGFREVTIPKYYVDALYMHTTPTFDSSSAERTGFRNFLEPFTLAIGEDTTVRTSFTVPAKRFGQQYVSVYTDIGQKVCELPYENNNVGTTQAVNIQLAPEKDLIVTNLNVSGSFIAGDPVTIQYDLENNGVGDVNFYPVVDSIFLLSPGGSPSLDHFLTTVEHDSGLVGTGEIAVTLSKSIPVLTQPGDYELLIRTDARDIVYEHQAENNNDSRSATFAVQRDPNRLPDLAVTQLNVQPPANSGQPLSFTYTVKNNTTKTTIAASWKDRVELLYPDSSWVVRRTLNRHQPLAGLDSYTRQSSITIPHGLEGPFLLRVVADIGHHVLEYNLDNNERVENLTVNLSPWPDLQITDLNSPDTLILGQMNTVPYDLLNGGAGDADTPWTDRLYLSTDEFLDPFDIRIYSDRPKTAGLAPSATYTHTEPFRLERAPTGYYFLIGQTDGREKVYEHTDEANNITVSNSQVYVHKPLPSDLSPVADSIILASKTYIPFQVMNNGPNPAKGSWTDVVYLSLDTIWDEDDFYVGAATIDTPSLPVGGRYNAYWSGNLPFVEPGWYYVLVKTDAFNYIPETDLTNNVRASSVPYYLDPVTPLTPDVPFDTAFPKFGWHSHYYSVPVQAGEGIIMRLDADTPSTAMELYYRKNALPHRGGPFDARGANAFQPSQKLLMPSDTGAYTGYGLSRLDFSYSDSVPYTIIAETRTFSLESILPNHGGNEGIVVLNIDGFDLSDSMRVVLQNNQDTIEAHHVFPFGPIEARAHINLNDVTPGVYDVILERLDKGGTATLQQAFTIEDTSYQEFYLQTMSPDRMLINTPFPVTVHFSNLGNINDYDVLLGIIIYRSDFKTDGFTVEYMGDGISNTLPPEGAALHPFDNTGLLEFDDGYLLLAWFPVLPAEGRSNFTFRLKGNYSDTLHVVTNIFRNPISDIHFSGDLDDLGKTHFMRNLLDIISPPDPAGAGFRNGDCNTNPEQLEAVIWAGVRQQAEYVSGGLPTNPDALAGTLLTNALKNTFNPEASPEPKGVIKDLVDGWKGNEKYLKSNVPGSNSYYEYLIKNLDKCLDLNDIEKKIKSECIYSYDKEVNGRKQRVYDTYCPKPPNPPNKNNGPLDKIIDIIRSWDPNEIVGPTGTGAPRYVSANEVLSYEVHFENLSTAGAPAQFVSIENPLPPTFDIRQFRLGEVGWGDTTIALPEAAYYTGSVQLGPKYFNHRVDIVAGIDVLNRKAFWRFTTIDPATGAPPSNPLAGFLPPNDTTGIGQGFVRYHIMAEDTLQAGTVLQNQAAIVFDNAEVLETNIWENTIGQEGLYSTVLSRPAFTDSTTFKVRWEVGYIDSFCADLDRVEVYVAEDTMPYERWISTRYDREGWFTGRRGHTYRFYSMAIGQDHVPEGKTVTSAEATTYIDTITGIELPEPPVKSMPQLEVYPNPFSGQLGITLHLPQSGEVRVPIYDLRGRVVDVVYTGYLPAGTHGFSWDPGDIAPGVYLVQCNGKNVVTGVKALYIR